MIGANADPSFGPLMAKGKKHIRVAELFAGVGGFRVGLERASEAFHVVFSNQWEPSTKRQDASDLYVQRFGEEGHSNVNIAEVPAKDIPDHDLLVGGFPCFVAGTMILTENGYRPIEEVRKGDLVLTHRGRWRKVTATMQREAPSTIILRGQGFPDIRTTAEHPFWTRELLGRAWSGGKPHRSFGEPQWTEAKAVRASKTYLSQVLPHEPPAPTEVGDWTEDHWWLVGRYLADGWLVSKPKGRVVICAAKKEAEEVEERIRRVFPCTPSVERTVVKFHITRQGFHDWLLPFGHGAEGKRLPGWVFTLPSPLATALLEGYSTGDGQRWQGGWRATTVSRALALSIALLAQRAYGVVASVHEAEVPPKKIIEGREVNQRKQYQVVVPPRNRSSFVSAGYGWKLVRSTKKAGAAQVFNISVKEDESYVADGCAVHNCQDYSVARTLNQSAGLEGKKGVLWWQIHRIISEKKKKPSYLLLENVDRLLKSPAQQRGRDFAIMLASLADLGYVVEWRMINAADYGMPQRRRRVFFLGYHKDTPLAKAARKGKEPLDWLLEDGVMATAFPATLKHPHEPDLFKVAGDLAEISKRFNAKERRTVSPFLSTGLMIDRKVWTVDTKAVYDGPRTTLGDIILKNGAVPKKFFITKDQVAKWNYLKGAKNEQRTNKSSGTAYKYSEGSMVFPDPLDKPSRTIITAEGGATPSRFKHVIKDAKGRLRRLTPLELERLNMFPDDHTAGARDERRAFLMGNALVTGIVERIGRELVERVGPSGK